MKFKQTCERKFKPIQDINQGTSSKINEHLKMRARQAAGDPKMFALFVLSLQPHGDAKGGKGGIVENSSNEDNLLTAQEVPDTVLRTVQRSALDDLT